MSTMYGYPGVVSEGIWSHATASYDVPGKTEAARIKTNSCRRPQYHPVATAGREYWTQGWPGRASRFAYPPASHPEIPFGFSVPGRGGRHT